MIEYLVDINNLKRVTPPRMSIGSFWTFKTNDNLMGIGQQAIHNSGSSMMKDTPLFKKHVIDFLNNHIKYDSKEFVTYSQFDILDFFKNQQSYLEEFKNNLIFRRECLNKIFIRPFVFASEIETKYLFISLMLYFIKEYNYFKSTQVNHYITKNEILKYYPNENNFILAILDILNNADKIHYLLDVCYGRYYFLEVHFLEVSNIRNTPLKIINEFFEISLEKIDSSLYGNDPLGLIEQEKITRSSGYDEEEDVIRVNNRIPELSESVHSKFKTNSRLAKTIIKIKGYRCEVNNQHETFISKFNELYVEAHHLVPMSAQNDFLPINIDRMENIISLCPTCHRAIHYGIDKEKILRLEKLYNDRVDCLNRAGIYISFDELLKRYY